MKRIILMIAVMNTLFLTGVAALSLHYRLESASRAIYEDDSTDLSIRVKPSVTAATQFLSNRLSANYQALLYTDMDLDFDYETYRLWLRYSMIYTDIRLGRQHINFGPAQLLRSLQWFDHIDPDDFFGETSGVNALLLRHYSANTSIWLWGILSENKLKGLEMYSSGKRSVEFGGRIDSPFLGGYLGLSTHYRPDIVVPKVSSNSGSYGSDDSYNDAVRTVEETAQEIRFGIDGRWDHEVGLWFEKVVCFIRDGVNENYSFLTLGSDYSLFRMNITAEHFMVTPNLFYDSGSYADRIRQITALTGRYNIGLLDELAGSLYYDHKSDDPAAMLYWQRTYDNWIINLGVFSYPDHNTNLFSGEGAILTVQYNL